MNEFSVLLNGNVIAKGMTQPVAIILADGILNNFQNGNMDITIRREQVDAPKPNTAEEDKPEPTVEKS